jgi:hypothetical protein
VPEHERKRDSGKTVWGEIVWREKERSCPCRRDKGEEIERRDRGRDTGAR